MTGVHIIGVSAGDGFASAVSASGQVYTWGSGSNGRLGHGDEQCCMVPRKVQAFAAEPIRAVAAGGASCFAITEGAKVVSWGVDLMSDADQFIPRYIHALDGVRARSAAVGGRHSLVVTEKGALYSIGRSAQLGHGSETTERSPCIMAIAALKHVRIIAAAASNVSSMALTADGAVFEFGTTCSGTFVASPRRVQGLDTVYVRAIAISDASNIAISATGELYTWGQGTPGILGHGDWLNQISPKQVNALHGKDVVAFSSSMFHAIAVTCAGGVFGFGSPAALGLPIGESILNDLPVQYPLLQCTTSSIRRL